MFNILDLAWFSVLYNCYHYLSLSCLRCNLYNTIIPISICTNFIMCLLFSIVVNLVLLSGCLLLSSVSGSYTCDGKWKYFIGFNPTILRWTSMRNKLSLFTECNVRTGGKGGGRSRGKCMQRNKNKNETFDCQRCKETTKSDGV